MPTFRTEIKIENSAHSVTLGDKFLTIGSCFSGAMGTRLTENKFKALVNPMGTIYNPHSIHKILRTVFHDQSLPDHTYLQNNELFLNYDFHSEFSAFDRNKIENKIKDVIHASHDFLKKVNWILITYGSAWVYERNDTGEIVSNCHKMPASGFSKSLLSQKKVLESFDEFYRDLKAFNPACKIILTVSPVRHIKDTLPLNSVSKSVLRLACQTISETYDNVFYFPSYEIMLDDLRDYRFYKQDMIHPSEEAEEYIWNKFTSCYFDTSTKEFIEQWKPILTALSHKPFHANTSAHQTFLTKTLSQLIELSKKVDVGKEIALVKSQLIN
jgi:hypothetical protein